MKRYVVLGMFAASLAAMPAWSETAPSAVNYEEGAVAESLSGAPGGSVAADDLAFERIYNTPKRGLGDKAQGDIQRLARAAGLPLLDGARAEQHHHRRLVLLHLPLSLPLPLLLLLLV